MSLKEKFDQMEKPRKIFIIIAIILGSIALLGFIFAAVGLSFSYPMLSFAGFILMIPFLAQMGLVLISYARV